MAYPYQRTTWTDRQVQNPMNFTATGTAAATSGGTLVLTPNEGTVTQTGTALTASVMNNIEQGIVDLNNNKLETGGGTVTGDLTIKANLWLQATNWSASKSEIYQNASSSSDNYGLVFSTGANNANKTVSLKLDPARNQPDYVDASGNVQPIYHTGNMNRTTWSAVQSYLSANQTVGGSTSGNTLASVMFNTFAVDSLTEMTSGIFTAKNAGRYQISTNLLLQDTQGKRVVAYITTFNSSNAIKAQYRFQDGNLPTTTYWNTIGSSISVNLEVGDYVEIQLGCEVNCTMVGGNAGWSYFHVTRLL